MWTKRVRPWGRGSALHTLNQSLIKFRIYCEMSIEIIQWILLCILLILVSFMSGMWAHSPGKCEALHLDLERVTKLAGVQLFRAGLCPNTASFTHQDTTYRLSSLATSATVAIIEHFVLLCSLGNIGICKYYSYSWLYGVHQLRWHFTIGSLTLCFHSLVVISPLP